MRPAAAPVVLVAGAFASGVALEVAGAVPPVVPPLLALLGGGVGIAAALRGSPDGRGWVVAAALLAAVLGMLRAGAAAPAARLPLGAGAVVLEGTVRDAPATHRGEALVIVDAARLAGAGGEARVEGGVLAAVAGHPDLGPGDRVRLEAAALRPPGLRPGPASAAALQRDGVAAVAVSPRLQRIAGGRPGVARALAAVRGHLAAAVATALPPARVAEVVEVAFGIHAPIPPDAAAALRDAGLIHLVATSGLKVAIVVGLLGRLAAALGLGPRRRLLLIVPALAGYVGIAGGGAAAARSAVMAGAGLALAGSGRRVRPPALLALTAAGFLAVEPRLSTDAGFQLSFLGTLGIVVLAGPLAGRLPGPRWLVEPFAVTVAAQLATLPVMASTFGVVSLAAPVANAVVIPAVPLLVVLAWAGAGLALLAPALGWPLLAAAGLIVAAVEEVARGIAAVPLAAVHLGGWPRAWTWALLAGLAAAALTATLAGRTPWRPGAAGCAALVAGAAALLVASRPDGRLHLVVLDTGGSAAELVRSPDGATALVDGGADPVRLAGALARVLPPLTRDLDLLVLSGGDRATAAGLVGLASGYRIGAVVVPDQPLGSGAEQALAGLRAAGAPLLRVTAGETWGWHGIHWRLLLRAADGAGPAAGAVEVAGGGGTALLLGALPPEGQEELAAGFGATLACDLLATPARGSVAPALLAVARPRMLAVPTARPGPPAAALASVAAVRTTALDGDLEYAAGPAGLVPA